MHQVRALPAVDDARRGWRWGLADASGITPFAPGGDPLSTPMQTRLVWMFLGLGVAARCVRFGLRFPLWGDECFLSVNLIDRGFGDMTGPLEYYQVAPILFLWAQLAIVKLLGFSEWSLRLLSFACGIGSLFLFRRLAGRLLGGTALVMAMAVFAVSYPGIRYSAEGKQYGIDMFVSLVLLLLTVEWWRRPERTCWLWCLAVFAPLAVGFSYPAAFVGGAVSLFVAAVLLSRGGGRGWLAWMGYNATLVGGFIGFYLLTMRGHEAAAGDFMRMCWGFAFPPLNDPLKLPGWLITAHAGDMLAFPVGGPRFASTATLIYCLLALGAVIRWRRTGLLLLGLAPLSLNLLAAALERYPYGGHFKFAHYLSPLVCVYLGLGMAVALAWWMRRGHHAGRALWGALSVVAMFGVVSMTRDVAAPQKTQSDRRARDFARWFWYNVDHDAEVACVKSDLGQDFSEHAFQELNWTALYLCNQRIYSPRHASGQPPRLDLVSDDRPLRCVRYKAIEWDFDQAAYDEWVQGMCRDYELVVRKSYGLPMQSMARKDRDIIDEIEVLEFVPRGERLATPKGERRRKKAR